MAGKILFSKIFMIKAFIKKAFIKKAFTKKTFTKLVLIKNLFTKNKFIGKKFILDTFSIGKIMKKLVFTALLTTLVLNACSCAFLQKSADKRTGFSGFLMEIENNIRNDDWENAKENLEESERAWKKIKPLLQIDIDHDYVNDIEENFIKLYAYIDTREKADSLATILLIKDVWENIGTF